MKNKLKTLIKNYLNAIFAFFLAGFLAAFSALVFSVLVFDFLNILKEPKTIILGGVFIEEFFRFLFLYFSISLTISNLKRFHWTLFLMSGLGFIFLEIFLILQSYSNLSLDDAIISYLPAAFVHLFNSLLLGYAILFSKNINFKKFVFLIFLIISVIIHLVFNMFANI